MSLSRLFATRQRRTNLSDFISHVKAILDDFGVTLEGTAGG
jgi:hypothetical protein